MHPKMFRRKISRNLFLPFHLLRGEGLEVKKPAPVEPFLPFHLLRDKGLEVKKPVPVESFLPFHLLRGKGS
ncbi:hypothetical protein IX321_000360 [Bacteroides pyogenes]|nr:hypothetical protein [Bacteroides pyogenes]MBR8716675.1 hypothetical protein [Bacteroides pyogenes]MBR8745957.1 hypothetical protein [Bacteroides pyogenes]MBR8756233.1 hypothetical protein [Bacteroides pyogenes]MBR8779460.1 hypothetical protein [Bacteroides pyogenes]